MCQYVPQRDRLLATRSEGGDPLGDGLVEPEALLLPQLSHGHGGERLACRQPGNHSLPDHRDAGPHLTMRPPQHLTAQGYRQQRASVLARRLMFGENSFCAR